MLRLTGQVSAPLPSLVLGKETLYCALPLSQLSELKTPADLFTEWLMTRRIYRKLVIFVWMPVTTLGRHLRPNMPIDADCLSRRAPSAVGYAQRYAAKSFLTGYDICWKTHL